MLRVARRSKWIIALMAQTSYQNAVQNTNSDKKSLGLGNINAPIAASQQTRWITSDRAIKVALR